MTRFLCATDLLPKSEFAIDRAGILAQELDADLSLLHVVSPTSSARILEQSLQIAVARMKARAKPPMWRTDSMPSVIVRTGNPARRILDTMADEDSDLVVVGPHRRRGVVDALEGTIAQKVLSGRRSPLLMVQRAPDTAYRNVLLALDLSAECSGVVRTAESLLRRAGARAAVVHAREPMYDNFLLSSGAGVAEVARQVHHSRHAAAAGVRDLLRRESADPTRYDIVIAEGKPVSAIHRAVELHGPDLLIMGTRGNGPLRRALLGSVANHLLKTAACDVLVVPRGSVDVSRAVSEKASAPVALHGT